MILKNVENCFVRYFGIKMREVRTSYDKPKQDSIYIGGLELIIEAGQNTRFDFDPYNEDKYNLTPIKYIIVSISTKCCDNLTRELIYLIIYLDCTGKRVVQIDTSGGIISQHPSFKELMRYITFTLGLKLNDFKHFTEKLSLLMIQLV